MTREELKAHCEKQIEMCEIQAIRMNEKPSGKIYEEHKLILELLEQQPCEMTVEEYRQRMIQAFHNADTDELLAICVRPTEKEFEYLEWLLKNHYKQEPCKDAVSRQAVQTRLKEIINEMETIFADIREREVDDSVCGLCEYDCDHGLDGFANECPGFEKDDCFKLNEKYRVEWLDISNLPSVTPQYTDAEIQKMQEMEQAEIEKAYELGKAEQPKRGRWIQVGSDKCKCDQCEVIHFIAMYPYGQKNYCPNCGAKMQEVEE